MPVKAEDFFEQAKELMALEQNEINIRSCISRCYYGMYHKVLSILDHEQILYPNKGYHGSLIHYLQTDAANDESLPFNSLKGLAYMLKQERDRRQVADYELSDAPDLESAQDSISTAERCLQRCDLLVQDNSTSTGTNP
ncbi:hypothetical protein NB463_09025 [Vibrio sp. RM-41-2B]|nr:MULTISPECIES: hypothetical protein [Vibrio]ELB2081777.1 hypothetical protein [Vibrio parahaemolyticus]MCR9550619.1 hypothetical protein [Vibrio sp. RM-41-2A]MCR9556234.1 hypothetical protein [Vibrio sp. RM-41-2B]MCR9975687.1 hypothetical protein [Vibrio parahaemolyticus]MCS0019513.1 hypothetical protein [Vibrio parahaemolyticus]